jgi:hypothetical protein
MGGDRWQQAHPNGEILETATGTPRSFVVYLCFKLDCVFSLQVIA